jgi:tetraacyldisaccharide 4'-kinase
MDDGLQNPTFKKDRVVLAVDGNFGFGNGLILPSGALRDKIKNIRKHVDLAVVINEDRTDVAKILRGYGIKFTNAKIIAKNIENFDKNIEYVAFCGLGRPEKFQQTLAECGIKIKKFITFGDHYSYRAKDIEALWKYNCKLITTEKDWVKLKDEDRETIEFLRVEIAMDKNALEGSVPE